MTSNKPFPLYLTSGSATGAILNANNTPGASLTTSSAGVPFNCDYLHRGSINGAEMTGILPLIDMPGMLGVTQDVLLALRFTPASNLIGTCSPSICYNDSDCDDLNPCTGVEVCDNHVCIAGTPPCDDGDVCNGTETCDATTGACGPGTVLNCDDGSACTTEICDPTLGCVVTDLCSDGDPCNGAETCLDPVAGTCGGPGSGTPIDCDDLNPCTDDACQTGIGCVHPDNTLPCDDLDLCTQNDTCGNGTCAGEPRPCSNGDACDGLEVCVPATGVCVNGPLPDCDDLNPCTDDSCDIQLGCVHVFNTAPCDDTNICTDNDICQSGVCAGAPRVCDDGNACNGIEVCDPLNGGCVSATNPDCDDQDECTIDSCVPTTGCDHQAVPDFATCRLTNIYLLIGQMAALVSGAPPASFGGVVRQQHLVLLLQQAKQSVQRAATSTGRKFDTSMTRGIRRLEKFTRLVRRGVRTGKIDPVRADEVIRPLQSIIGTMRQLQ